MTLAIIRKKTNINILSDGNFSEEEKNRKRQDNIRSISLEISPEKYEYIYTIPLMNELISNEFNNRRVKEKSLDYTTKAIHEGINENIVNPLGIEFAFTKISQDVTSIFLNRNPLTQIDNEGISAPFYTHEVRDSHFFYTSPKENLKINKSELVIPQFTFKTHTVTKHRIKCE